MYFNLSLFLQRDSAFCPSKTLDFRHRQFRCRAVSLGEKLERVHTEQRVYPAIAGAFCKAGTLRCTAPEYAVVNYLNREVTSKFMFGFRSDFLDDKKGQRTGFATKYAENTLYATRYIGSTIMIRPELRFDHSWDLAAQQRKGQKPALLRNGLDLQILRLVTKMSGRLCEIEKRIERASLVKSNDR
jgi:hypothetical protein